MNDTYAVILAVWGILSVVTLFVLVIEFTFSNDSTLVVAYSRFLRYAIDGRGRFSLLGKLVVVPVYTLTAIALTIPSLTVIGTVYLLCWISYQCFKLAFLKG